MVALRSLLLVIRGTLDEWQHMRLSDLEFAQGRTAMLMLAVLGAISLIVLLASSLRRHRPGRRHVTLPAVLPVMRRSLFSPTRHGAFLLFLFGIPFFAVALADPYTALTREEVSYPGRRIAILIDASSSMSAAFTSVRLTQRKQQTGVAFFTTVAAAEYFVKLRMNGPYRDLISLIEFGNEAYVLTPFTTDYQNLLLSMSLIDDWGEWMRFPDQGTVIIQAINRGTQLFQAFDFLNASGNLMVIFSDGEDNQVILQGRPLDEILAEARKHAIPVYMIRMAYNKSLGAVLPDSIWKSAVERTGGRFYPAANEETVLRAVQEIDRLSAGRIDVREYTTERPRFSGYALIAVALWLAAGTLKLGFRHFRTFP